MYNNEGTAENAAHITRVGHIAQRIFDGHCEGVVYAVFNSTFYLKASHPALNYPAQWRHLSDSIQNVKNESDHQRTRKPTDARDSPDYPVLLCCIGRAKLTPGPLNISTTLGQLPDVSVGDVWHGNQHGISIGRFRLSFNQSSVWQPMHRQPFVTPSQTTTDLLAHIVATCASPRQSPSNSVNNAIEATLTQSTTQLQRWLYESDSPRGSTEFPMAMIGCGGGLTPTGDDILVGVLLGLFVWNQPLQAQLNTEVKKHLSLTSELSAAHLLCACAGSAIAPLHDLINAMHTDVATAEADDARHRVLITEAAHRLCQHGHSSGYFAMTGLLVAAQVQNGIGANDVSGA